MNNEFRFEKWKVYKDSKQLFKEIFIVYKKLPNEIKYSVGNQLLNSSLSILLNIVEGSGKSSDKDFNRFIDIAIGSIYETYASIDVLKDINMLEKSQFNMLKLKLNSVKNQLGGFKKRLK